MSQMSTLPPPSTGFAAGDDPFRYGWRYVRVTRPDGRIDLEQIPLTLEDVLHPQEGDVIPENSQQERDRRYLHDVYESRYADDPGVLTLSDCLIDWDDEDVRPLAPDLAVLEGVRTKDGAWGMYRLGVDGGRALLVGEIVSPHTRSNDVKAKREYYSHLGVPWYVLVDQEREDGPRRLIVYRRTPEGYAEVPPDREGRVRLPGDVLIALEEGRVICYDAETGQELGDYTRVSQQLEEEVAARREAEEKLREESEARHRAEGQAREQTEARVRAEGQAREESEARVRAEEQARQAEEVRKDLEARLRALEERLKEQQP